jgi:hypothetical protein
MSAPAHESLSSDENSYPGRARGRPAATNIPLKADFCRSCRRPEAVFPQFEEFQDGTTLANSRAGQLALSIAHNSLDLLMSGPGPTADYESNRDDGHDADSNGR